MLRFWLFLIAASGILQNISLAGGETHSSTCWCAALNPSESMEPVLAQPISLPLSCLETDKCATLCVSLANASREDPDSLKKVCSKLKEADKVKIHVYSKLCESPYVFTGFYFNTPLCCSKGEFFKCTAQASSSEAVVE